MSFEGKSRWLPVQAAVLAVPSLKRSSPVARKLSVLRPAKAVRRRSATI